MAHDVGGFRVRAMCITSLLISIALCPAYALTNATASDRCVCEIRGETPNCCRFDSQGAMNLLVTAVLIPLVVLTGLAYILLRRFAPIKSFFESYEPWSSRQLWRAVIPAGEITEGSSAHRAVVPSSSTVPEAAVEGVREPEDLGASPGASVDVEVAHAAEPTTSVASTRSPRRGEISV
eukprot:gnl/TRDRNA2_/TRDRNA2_196050_c0_seq1.p1 gnl/TRDRNA2_/TRDRNA2_196050_c0~~gnl/TRDRNA2_/TRDRNA2_196050_c0_seq1.p1  ORF type:complete len:209 (-),score=17.68 gnl/TRDRNA2_/TRDRNA2_196050_c0_seq1:47-583(-)